MSNPTIVSVVRVRGGWRVFATMDPSDPDKKTTIALGHRTFPDKVGAVDRAIFATRLTGDPFVVVYVAESESLSEGMLARAGIEQVAEGPDVSDTLTLLGIKDP